MVCKKCGEEIPDNSKFCLSCGEKVEIQLTDPHDNTEPGKSSKSSRQLIIAGVIISVVLCAMVLIASLFSKGPAKPAPETTKKQSSYTAEKHSASTTSKQTIPTKQQTKELTNEEVYQFLDNFAKTKFYKVTVSSSNAVVHSGSQNVFVDLIYTASHSGKQSKTMLLNFSKDLAAAFRDEFPSISEISLEWSVPALDATALYEFENTGKGTMNLTSQFLDPIFDSDAKPEPVSQQQTTQEQTSSDPVETLGQKNALKKAYSYLKSSAFSRSRLIDQLKYEGFSDDESLYAVDHCGANWKEQAAKKAQSYLEHSAFSKSGLLDQLLYEGFSQEEAEYGVAAVGY